MSNRCHPLSTSSFQEVKSQVTSFYDRSMDKVKIAVGAMIIKMRDIIVTKGNVNSSIDTSDSIEFACAQIVDLHNSVLSQALTIQRPPAVLVGSTPYNRLKKGNNQHTVRTNRNTAMDVLSTHVWSKDK